MNSPAKLVIATNNPGKLKQFQRLLANQDLQIYSLTDIGFTEEIVEDGASYADNAIIKAETVAAAVQIPALADDSGIEVKALDNWPGVNSARWFGDGASDGDRLHGLLDEVEQRCPGDRRVRYVSVVALARPGLATVTAVGECDGELVAPQGNAGFGYDPAFLSADLGVTFGEANDQQKDLYSHRGKAVRNLIKSLDGSWL